MKEQLPLSLQFQESLRFDNFVVESNQQAVDYLTGLIQQSAQSVYLWGENGTGKTHLCQSLYHHYFSHALKPAYFDAEEQGISPQLLDNLEQFDCLIIDSVDCLIADEAWQEALFHAFNRFIQQDKCLIFSARSSIQAKQSILPDLSSRLLSGMIFQIKPLSDEGKIEALKIRAKENGLTLIDEVIEYWIRRCARDTNTLFEQLRQLDNASLIHKRKITIPFIKKILSI